MAFLSSYFGCTVTFMDGGTNLTQREYTMDETIATFEDAVTAAEGIVGDLVAMSDAAFPRYRVWQNYDEGSLVVPATTVQIENTASLTVLLTAAGAKKANLNVPAPKASIFVNPVSGPQNNIVNMGSTLVTDFLANFLVSGDFTVSDGEEVARGLSGKRVHKKSNKG